MFFCVDGYVVIFAMRFGQLSIRGFPFRGFPYFLSFGVCSSVVGTVYPSRRWFLLLKALWALTRLQKSLPARFRMANVARRRFFAVLGRQTSHEGVSMPYRCRFQPMARRTTVIQHSWALKRSRKSYWPDIGWKTTLGAVSLPFSADGEKNNDN